MCADVLRCCDNARARDWSVVFMCNFPPVSEGARRRGYGYSWALLANFTLISCVCTRQCILFEYFTLEMKGKDVKNVDENWRAKVAFPTCIGVEKLAPRGPAICSQYIIVHFIKDVSTNEQTNDLSANNVSTP